MAEQPIFPDESNMERFRDFANVQQEISEHLRVQKHLYEQIGRINRDVEDRVIKRRQAEFRMLNIIQGQNVKYNDLVAKRVKAKSWEVKDLEGQISSTLQMIQNNRTLIDLSKLASENEIAMAKKQHEEGNRWFKFAGEEIQKMLGLDLKQFEAVKATGDKMMLLGNVTEGVAYTWGAILVFVKGAYDLFNKMDKAAWDFRKAMGMTRIESAVIRKDAQRIAIDYMDIGVTIESIYKSYQSLGKMVGGVHNVTKSMAEDVTIMAAQFGISEEVSAGFLRNLAVISKSSMESKTNMMYMAQDMSSAAGVQLSEIMGDVATKSNKTLLLMSRLPNVALRTAIELRRMGTSMSTAANAGAHVLNFSESINEEMEASVLLGRHISMQNIRQLTYARNLEGAAKATVALAQKHGFATKMDYFQMQAFARMTGYSEEQLLNMVQTSEQLEKIRRHGTPRQIEQLALYEKMRMENEMAAKARATDSSALLRTMNNQTRLVAISAKWNQILAKAQSFLFPIIDGLLSGVVWAMDIGKYLAPVIGQMYTAYTYGHYIVDLLRLISATTMGWGKIMKPISIFFGVLALGINRVWEYVIRIGGAFSKLGKYFSFLKSLESLKIIMVIAKSLGKFTVVLNIVFAVWNVLKAIINGVKNFAQGFMMLFESGKRMAGLGKMLHGIFQMTIGAILGAVEGVFGFVIDIPILLLKGLGWAFGGAVKKFADMVSGWWDAIKDWLGFSPSKVGLMIVRGITSIGGLLLNALVSPFKLAFVAIVKLGPTVGKLIWKGITMYFNMWKTLGTAVLSGAKYLGEMAFNGISSVKDRIVEVLKSPFQSAWSWVKSLWGGNSPSQVGMSILNGIVSIGTGMYDALTAPFRKGIAWIMDRIPGMSKIAQKLRGDVSGSVEMRAQAAYIPAVTVTPEGTKIAGTDEKTSGGKPKVEEKGATLDDVVAGNKEIIGLLKSILAKDTNINMDGQLLSTHLARSTEFMGGYGVNKVA